jgi:hypothetical protein
VDPLLREQVPAKQLFHDENVLEYVGAASCSRMIRGMHHDVSGLVLDASTSSGQLPVHAEMMAR